MPLFIKYPTGKCGILNVENGTGLKTAWHPLTKMILKLIVPTYFCVRLTASSLVQLDRWAGNQLGQIEKGKKKKEASAVVRVLLMGDVYPAAAACFYQFLLS